jgi:hypothetical protein
MNQEYAHYRALVEGTFEASLAGGSSAHDWLMSNLCQEEILNYR